MNEPSRKTRGYCPSVWTPMPSGDGLIVRVRPVHARASAEHLAALARLARASGNGIVELTRRGNLQIRGVSAASWPSLRAELVELGLAGVEAESEQRPALFVCPLSGLDPRCPPLEPLADALAENLVGLEPDMLEPAELITAAVSTPGIAAPPMPATSGATPARFHSGRGTLRLPDKFGIVLSGGSQSASDLAADIHVRLHPAHPGECDLLLAGKVHDATPLGACPVSAAPQAVRALVQALAAHPSERRRMRDAVAVDLPGLRHSVQHLLTGAARREAAWGSPEVGYHTGSSNWFGYAMPFGSATAEDWVALARVAERFGAGELRFTPTRHVLVVGVRPEDRQALLDFGQRRAFGVRKPARALELVACSGAPACGSANGETRALARLLDKLLGKLPDDGRYQLPAPGAALATLHVSGCEKSCARNEAADITLVHGPNGLHLGFGRDVQGTLLTRPLSLDGVREQLVERFLRARPALRDSGQARERGR
jgi:precorrin-3B synthase